MDNPLRVKVGTYPIPFVAGRDDCALRDTDLSKPGNMKWLKSHIKWAARNNKSVTISPESN
jgi:hypothetical protein